MLRAMLARLLRWIRPLLVGVCLAGLGWVPAASALDETGKDAPSGEPWVIGGPTPAGGDPGATTSAAPAQPAKGDVTRSSAAVSPRDDRDADPAALTVFRRHLDAHGRWVDDSRYGRVWIPNSDRVGKNFVPYVTSGHWELDENSDWVWVSDHPFGWIVFHYGRWILIPDSGWAWVPGLRYAPSWVVWRVPSGSYAYVGWAPMPPYYGWFGGSVIWYSALPPPHFVFCPSGRVFHRSVGWHLVRDRGLVVRLAHNSRIHQPWPRHGHRVSGDRAWSPSPNQLRIPREAIPRERIAARPRRFMSEEGEPAAPLVRRSSPSNGSRPARPTSRSREERRQVAEPRVQRSSERYQRRPEPTTRSVRDLGSPVRQPMTPGWQKRSRSR